MHDMENLRKKNEAIHNSQVMETAKMPHYLQMN
jgi:hypothetical protein